MSTGDDLEYQKREERDGAIVEVSDSLDRISDSLEKITVFLRHSVQLQAAFYLLYAEQKCGGVPDSETRLVNTILRELRDL